MLRSVEFQINQLVWVLAALAFAWILGGQIASIRLADRTVQVRGSAEMPVVADIATWSLNFSATGNDLAAVQREMNHNLEVARSFLTGVGIKDDEIEVQALSVSDAQANQYNQNAAAQRFAMSGGVTVRTGNLQAVVEAKNNLGKLVGQGVVLTNSYGPNFSYTKLNEAKLDLVSRATAEARKAAEQFAADSGAKVGAIRRAQQGSVQILGRDSFFAENEQVNKVLRVVTTVDYDLK